jgi:hypothetical protein
MVASHLKVDGPAVLDKVFTNPNPLDVFLGRQFGGDFGDGHSDIDSIRGQRSGRRELATDLGDLVVGKPPAQRAINGM